MEVILLSDIKSVGKKDDIVKLSDGYARNFVLKKGLGVEANKQNLYELEQRKEKERQEALEILELAKKKKEEIEKVVVKLTSKEVSDGLNSQHNIEIDKRKIVVENPIKTLGEFNVPIKLHPDVTASLKVIIGEE